MSLRNRTMEIIYEDPNGGTFWLGCLFAAQDLTLLEEFGITTVITIAKGIKINYPSYIRQIRFDIQNEPTFNLKPYFENVVNSIGDGLSRGSVLIHCETGISSSATFAIAYLMKRRFWTDLKAFNYVQERRIIDPNPNFKKQLKDYYKDLQIYYQQIELILLGNSRTKQILSNESPFYDKSHLSTEAKDPSYTFDSPIIDDSLVKSRVQSIMQTSNGQHYLSIPKAINNQRILTSQKKQVHYKNQSIGGLSKTQGIENSKQVQVQKTSEFVTPLKQKGYIK